MFAAVLSVWGSCAYGQSKGCCRAVCPGSRVCASAGETKAVKSPEIIAHRGYWKAEGAVQNSRAAVKAAADLGLYGAEIDIWLTTDGCLMVNHDPSYDGVTIKDATSERCRKLVLKNGEKMPVLEDMLGIIKASPGRTRLIIEVKDHGDDALSRKAASAAVKAVKEAGIQRKVEYISFSDAACRQIIADDPAAGVAYLSGGIAPDALRKAGYTGLDYHMNEYRTNPQWIKDAHGLGMAVNVWTVTSEEDLNEMIGLNVDFITTDDPVKALEAKAACGR